MKKIMIGMTSPGVQAWQGGMGGEVEKCSTRCVEKDKKRGNTENEQENSIAAMAQERMFKQKFKFLGFMFKCGF